MLEALEAHADGRAVKQGCGGGKLNLSPCRRSLGHPPIPPVFSVPYLLQATSMIFIFASQ